MKLSSSIFAILFAILQLNIARSADQPSVVLILCDDLGIGDVACFNPDSKIATPNMDAIAAAGVKLTNAHSPSSVCTPTRYGILTGRYAWRTRLQSGVLGGTSPPLIAQETKTIAEMFKSAGYTTGCFGKWHLGLSWPAKDEAKFNDKIEKGSDGWKIDFAKSITDGPLQHGFDRYFGISASLDMVPYSFIDQDRVVSLPDHDDDYPMSIDNPSKRTRRGPTSPNFDAVNVLPEVTNAAIRWIEQTNSTSPHKPFFAYIPLASPHTPIVPGEQWKGQSKINAYADFVMQTDHAIGQIKSCLKNLELEDNTILIVTSDNGCSPEANYATLLKAGHNPSFVYRGTKADIFEGGHRVPMLIQWPNKIEPNQASDGLVGLQDIMATLAELIAQPLEPNDAPDSQSFAKLLGLDSDTLPRESLVHHSINGSFAITQTPWKICVCPDSGGWSQPRPGSADVKTLPPFQLFNMQEDIAETDNRISDFPLVRDELLMKLGKIIEDGRSTPGPKLTNDRVISTTFLRGKNVNPDPQTNSK